MGPFWSKPQNPVQHVIDGPMRRSAASKELPQLVRSRSTKYHDIEKALVANDCYVQDKDKRLRTGLHYAAEMGRTEVVSLLIEHGADLGCQDIDGMTVFMLAALNKCCDTFCALLEKTCLSHLNLANNNDETVLHCLARVGSHEMVKNVLVRAEELSKEEAFNLAGWINRRTGYEGPSAVHIAAGEGHLTILKHLLAAGGNLELPDEKACTGLHYAAEKGRVAVVEFILQLMNKHGDTKLIETPDNNLRTPSHCAAYGGQLGTLKCLVAAGGDIKSTELHKRTVLAVACHMGHVQMVEYLLTDKMCRNASLDVLEKKNEYGESPLHLAAQQGHKRIVSLLCQHGANVDTTNRLYQTPLMTVAEKSLPVVAVNMTQHLISLKATLNLVDSRHRCALHSAVLNRQAHVRSLVVKELLKECPSLIDMADDCGLTPLHLAAQTGHLDCFRTILQSRGVQVERPAAGQKNVVHFAAESGFPRIIRELMGQISQQQALSLLNQQDSTGQTPIHVASVAGKTKVVELLLQGGASPDSKDHRRRIPLHYAAESGKFRIVEILLEHSPSIIDATDHDDETPLMLACRSGQLESVQILLGRNASFLCEDVSALDIAVDNGHEEIAKLLLGDDRWSLLLSHSHQFRAFDIIVKMPSAAKQLLDNFVTEDKATGETHYNLYHLYYSFPTPPIEHQPKRRSSVVPRPAATLRQSFRPSVSIPLGGRGSLRRQQEIVRFDSFDFLDGKSERDYQQLSDSSGSEGESGSTTTGEGESFDEVDRLQDRNMVTERDAYRDDEEDEQRQEDQQNDCICYGRVENIPEDILECQRHELLLHPVIKEWARCKWQGLVFKFNLLYFLLYVIFLIFLLSFVLHHKPGRTTTYLTCEKETCSSLVSSYQLQLAISFLLALFVIGEFIQMARVNLRAYLSDISNHTQWAMYIPTAVLILPIEDQPTSYQWLAGSVAVFLAWTNLILSVQRTTVFGIYVAMFIQILRTAMQALVVVLLFIFAFGFTFHILLSHQENFRTVGESLMKTVGMSLGEIDLAETFLSQAHTGSVGWEHILHMANSWIFILLFILILPVLLQNMLIALAVGETAEVKRTAMVNIAVMQVHLILEWERMLPEFLLKRFSHCPVSITKKDLTLSWWAKVRSFFTGMVTESEAKEEDASGIERVEKRLNELAAKTHLTLVAIDHLRAQLDHQSQQLQQVLRKQRSSSLTSQQSFESVGVISLDSIDPGEEH